MNFSLFLSFLSFFFCCRLNPFPRRVARWVQEGATMQTNSECNWYWTQQPAYGINNLLIKTSLISFLHSWFRLVSNKHPTLSRLIVASSWLKAWCEANLKMYKEMEPFSSVLRCIWNYKSVSCKCFRLTFLLPVAMCITQVLWLYTSISLVYAADGIPMLCTFAHPF